MKTSSSVTNIVPALLKAQKLMGGAKKGASNPYFKSKYADLGSVLEACKELLNEHGVVIMQPHSQHTVETVLWHESGEFISSETPVVCSKQNDPQALGSAITYARRYGLQSLLSMPAEDDDGEGAMSRSTKATTAQKLQELSKSDSITTLSVPATNVTQATVQSTPTTEAPKKSSFRNKVASAVASAAPVATQTSTEEDLGLS